MPKSKTTIKPNSSFFCSNEVRIDNSIKDHYILDTNVIINYPEIIPNGNQFPSSSNIKPNKVHFIICTTVIQELSNFKNENTERGRVARQSLDRLRKLFEKNHFQNLNSNNWGDNSFLIPLDESEYFIFSIIESAKKPELDPDWEIILFAKEKQTSISEEETVTILTGDNGLAINARTHEIRTMNFFYQLNSSWTGKKEVYSDYFLEKLIKERYLSGESLRQYFNNSYNPVANEFIIFQSAEREGEDDIFYDYQNIGRYDKEQDEIVPLTYYQNSHIKPKNVNQLLYLEALMNPSIDAILVTGPAGSGKTYLATNYAYHACRNQDFLRTVVVPCAADNNIGSLPGDLNKKMEPQIRSIKESLTSFLYYENEETKKRIRELTDRKKNSKKNSDKSTTEYLENLTNMIYDNWFDTVPVDYAKGRSFIKSILIFDEFQDQSKRQADMLIKRIGPESKIVICGDVEQVRAAHLDKNNNGITFASELLYDCPYVARISLDGTDVVRHPLVKWIAEKQQ